MKTYRQFITEKREPEDEYYYHLTKGKNMPGIAKKGLVRQPGTRNYNFSKRKAVYLATTPKDAKQYASDMGVSWHGYREKPNSLRVVRIPKTSIDPKKLHRDRNMVSYDDESDRAKPGTWEYHGDIPAKKIEFSGGEHLKKKSKAWKRATGWSNKGVYIEP